MRQYFYWRPSFPETILFRGAEVHTPEELAITCGAFMLLGLVFETLKCYRLVLVTKNTANNQISSCVAKQHLVQTAIFMVEFVFAYFLMLIIMSYNVWLVLAVLVGTTIGYAFCGAIKRRALLHPPRVVHSKQECHGKLSEVETHDNGTAKEKVELMSSV